MGCKKVSILKIPLSLVALFVSKIAIGIMMIAEIHDPKNAVIELFSANPFPKVFEK